MRTITISDVTMKQPADQGGFALSFREKIEFAKLLDRLHVDVIEVSAIANRRVDTLLIKSTASAVREAAVAVPLALDGEDAAADAWRALAEARIRRYLKYVVQYQYDLLHVPFLPLAVREAMVVSAARYGKTDSARRLRQLRTCEHLSAEKVGIAVGIPVRRLRAIEDGQAVPDAQELLRLAAFYGVCADSILKGEHACGQH